jgi:hypothetical protein
MMGGGAIRVKYAIACSINLCKNSCGVEILPALDLTCNRGILFSLASELQDLRTETWFLRKIVGLGTRDQGLTFVSFLVVGKS